MTIQFQDNYDDRPAPVIHRNFDDCFSSPNSNSLNLMQNLTIPLTSLPGLVSDAEVTEVTEEEFQAEQQPVFPTQTVELSPKEAVKALLQVYTALTLAISHRVCWDGWGEGRLISSFIGGQIIYVYHSTTYNRLLLVPINFVSKVSI